MADDVELYKLRQAAPAGFVRVIEIELLKQAQVYLDSDVSTTAQRKWSVRVMNDSRGEAIRAWPIVLMANAGLTVAQIEAATETAIATNVQDIAPQLADGVAG